MTFEDRLEDIFNRYVDYYYMADLHTLTTCVFSFLIYLAYNQNTFTPQISIDVIRDRINADDNDSIMEAIKELETYNILEPTNNPTKYTILPPKRRGKGRLLKR